MHLTAAWRECDRENHRELPAVTGKLVTLERTHGGVMQIAVAQFSKSSVEQKKKSEIEDKLKRG